MEQTKKQSRMEEQIPTQGYVCMNLGCEYHGITSEGAHALGGNGKRGKGGDALNNPALLGSELLLF